MQKEKLKIDMRYADKDDMLALARLLMSFSHMLKPHGYTIHVKKSQSCKPVTCNEQKIT